MIYIQMFLCFAHIGVLSFGGGYVSISLIQNLVVETYGWLSMKEFTDIVSISQMTPGPISVNAATFVGIQMAGIPGAIICTLGCIFPSCVLVSVLAYFYARYKKMDRIQKILLALRPVVVAMILSAAISLFQMGVGDWVTLTIFILSLILLRTKKINQIHMMIIAAMMSLFLYSL